MRKLFVIVPLLSCLTGCGALVMPSALDEGHFLLMGDANGVSAYSRGQVGMIDSGKNAPNTDSSFWVSERLESREKTKRSFAPSWIQKWLKLGVDTQSTEK